MAEHTALPWQQHGRFVVAKGQTDTWDGPVWGAIARAEPLSADDSDGRHWTADGDEKANADFIVRAVNSHYQLVEALRSIDRQVSHAKMGDWSIALDEIRKVCRAALSSLKGTDHD